MIKKMKSLWSTYDKHFSTLFFVFFLSGFLISTIKDKLSINYSLASLSGLMLILFDFIIVVLFLLLGAWFINRKN